MGMIAQYARVEPAELDEFIENPGVLEQYIFDREKADNVLDIDKAWHGIHWLLNLDPWEGEGARFNVVLGGTELGEDYGYGPARYLSAQEVKEVADELDLIEHDELIGNFDSAKMAENEIYPSVWGEEPDEDALQYLMDHYKYLVSFFREAANMDQAMLLWIC